MATTESDTRVEPSPNTRSAGVIAVMSASLFWSFGGVLGKSTGASGIVLSFWRLWIAVAVLAAVSATTHRWPSWTDLKASALAGVLFGVNLCAFFITLQYTTIAVALIIGALSPVLALPIAVTLMGERLTLMKLGCAVLAVAGVVVAVLMAPVASDGSTTRPIGYVWAVISLLVWVLYLLQTKRVRVRVETVRYMTSVTLIGAVTVSCLVLVTRGNLSQIHGAGWLWVTLLAIGPGIAGHGLVAWAQPRVDASVTSVLIQFEPVGASIVAWVALDERVSLAQGVAMVVVVAALSLLAVRESRIAVVNLDEAVG
ncbi:MAG TPA: DMT family transporter [Ilumatobacteraceae bacterium]|nr:DMT family transporter [Ilumatobacteraceae bacterium]HRB04619.1 DMT family transporter [Ilumatobacteraceae bacterium]